MKSITILKDNFETRKGWYGPSVQCQRIRATVNDVTNELMLGIVRKTKAQGRGGYTKSIHSIRFWDFGKATMEENVATSLDYFFQNERVSALERHFIQDVIHLLLPHTTNLLTYAKLLSYRSKSWEDYVKFSDFLSAYGIKRPFGYTGDFWIAPDHTVYWYRILTEGQPVDDGDLDARRTMYLPPHNFREDFKFCPYELRHVLLGKTFTLSPA